MDLTRSWCEPLPDESDAAFQAFRFYRGLWAPARDVTDVVAELGPINSEITLASCRSWAREFRWSERAAQYDAWKDQRELVRQERVKDARARVDDRKGSIGLSFLDAAQASADALVRSPDSISAGDAIKLAKAGEALLTQGEAAGGDTRKLSDRLDKLTTDDLETLLELLERAGIDPDEI